jgi:hypothetical protein
MKQAVGAMVSKNPAPYLLHIAGWALFIFFEVSLVSGLTHHTDPVWNYLFYYSINIGLFYCCIFLAFPKAFGKRIPPFILLPVFAAIVLAVYLCLSFAAIPFFQRLRIHNTTTAIGTGLPDILKTMYRGTYFLMLAVAYWFPIQFIRRGREAAELEKRLIRSQNAYLQSRLNPHLLFNSLNFLQDITYGSREASRCIELLADSMRYSMEEPDENGTVPLNDEIKQVEKYIELNQLRVKQTFNLTCDMKPVNPNVRIIPLLLLSLIENMFQHGSLLDSEQAAFLRIECTNNRLLFQSSNVIRRGITSGNGLGLANNRIRLENHYSGKFRLETRTQNDRFTVDLSIQLA